MDNPNNFDLMISAVLAAIIMLSIWATIFRNISAKIDSFVDPSTTDRVRNKGLIYFICAIFWPAALVMGYEYLQQPETARTGRTCIRIFLWFVTLLLLLVISAVFIIIMYFPVYREILFR